MAQRRRFDPEGDSYDEQTGDKLRRRYPLPKATVPSRWQRTHPFRQRPDEVPVIGAFESWVWHPEVQRYLPHGGSVTSDIDLLEGLEPSAIRGQLGDDVYVMLKGRNHPTWDLGVKAEETLPVDAGGPRRVVPGPGGRYFSVPKGRPR